MDLLSQGLLKTNKDLNQLFVGHGLLSPFSLLFFLQDWMFTKQQK